jgi:dissimilatory sulfite reductase (desulfoviridin) alpha/beta subunit
VRGERIFTKEEIKMVQGQGIPKPVIYKNMPAVFQRKDEKFEIKLQVTGGLLTPLQVQRIGEVASKYGSRVHFTVRQEVLILGLSEENLDRALAELKEVGLTPGSAGMVFRNVVSCLGTDYCYKAVAETIGLAREIGDRFTGEKTPGPLKVAIGGCAFPCTRPQFNEIGLMGRVRPEIDLEKCIGCGKCVEVCKVGLRRSLRERRSSITISAFAAVGVWPFAPRRPSTRQRRGTSCSWAAGEAGHLMRAGFFAIWCLERGSCLSLSEYCRSIRRGRSRA